MILRKSDCFSTLCSRLVCSPVTEVHRIRLDSAIILCVVLIIRANTVKRSVLTMLLAVIVAGTILGAIILLNEQEALGCGLLPCFSTNTESLWLKSYQISSPTNATLRIGNNGPQQTTLLSYNVRDSYGDQYNSTNWSGPTITPGTIAVVNMPIDGRTFTFQAGQYYTITVETIRNYHFAFSISS